MKGKRFSTVKKITGMVLVFMFCITFILPVATWADESPPPPASQISIYSTYGGNYTAVMGNPAVLVESGSEASARNIIFPALKKEGYAPKTLAISHFHKNQAEGAEFLHKRERFSLIIAPPSNSPGAKKYPFLHGKSPTLYRGMQWVDKNGNTLTLLDCPDSYSPPSKSADDNVLVFLWEQSGQRVLFLSDAGYKTEQRLRLHYPSLQADIVVVGVNISDLPISDEYISSLKPKLVVLANRKLRSSNGITCDYHSLKEQGFLKINIGDPGN